MWMLLQELLKVNCAIREGNVRRNRANSERYWSLALNEVLITALLENAINLTIIQCFCGFLAEEF
jgi:hypothetical protein